MTASLIDWFSTLTPEQRLTEMESRISFFYSLRLTDESELSRDFTRGVMGDYRMRIGDNSRMVRIRRVEQT